MDTNNIILICLLTFFAIFALYKEITEHDDAFTFNTVSKRDSIPVSLRKIEKCLSYEQKTIKWRRILISTLISIIMIFGLLHKRIPTAKELLIYFFIIFVVFYTCWQDYARRTAYGAVIYGVDNIENIKAKLSENRKFIFPWK